MTVSSFVAPSAPGLVTLQQPATLSLYAPAGSETVIDLTSATTFSITVGGQQFDYSTSQFDAVQLVGATNSTLVVVATGGALTASLGPNWASISTANLKIQSLQATDTYVYGSTQATASLYGVKDVQPLYGGASQFNTLVDVNDYAYMDGSGYSNFVVGFGQTNAQSGGSLDTAYFYAAAGSTYVGTGTYSYLSTGGYYNQASGFSDTLAIGPASGAAQAWFYSPSTGGTFYASAAYSYLSGSGFFDKAQGFSSDNAVSNNTSDYAYFVDTAGGTTFTGTATGSTLVGQASASRHSGSPTSWPPARAMTGQSFTTAILAIRSASRAPQVSLVHTTGTTLLNSFGEVTAYVTESNGTNIVDYFYDTLA